MEREIQFVNIMTEKLKTQGDISPEEAARIFTLATVIYSYEMGWHGSGRYRESFNYRGFIISSPIEDALGNWYKEVFSRTSDEYRNFLASIPSRTICPRTVHFWYSDNFSPPVIQAIGKIQHTKESFLEKSLKTSDLICANQRMVEWLKNNVPLSFDIMYCYKWGWDFKVQFARFGVLGLLPIYEREVEESRFRTLPKFEIPVLWNENTRKDFYNKYYAVSCPLEYRDILDAVADAPFNAPELSLSQPANAHARIPQDISYINSLTSRLLSGRDISLEEADDLYLLFKMYQSIKTAALKGKGVYRQEIKEAAEPGLKALCSWYGAVEKELKRKKSGNFVYTLPKDMSMNLYQIRKPVEKCLKMLPTEPSEVEVRYNAMFPIKDVCLDTRHNTIGDKYAVYYSNRYGFFARNGVDVNRWKTVALYNKYGSSVFDAKHGDATLGKLRFAESLGINLIVMDDNWVAVDEKDYDRIAEVMRIPDHEIMQMAHKMMRKELSEITQRIEELKKSANDIPWEKIRKLATVKEDMELAMREGSAELRFLVKSVEILYNMQKEKDEYLEEDEWMEIDR